LDALCAKSKPARLRWINLAGGGALSSFILRLRSRRTLPPRPRQTATVRGCRAGERLRRSVAGPPIKILDGPAGAGAQDVNVFWGERLIGISYFRYRVSLPSSSTIKTIPSVSIVQYFSSSPLTLRLSFSSTSPYVTRRYSRLAVPPSAISRPS